MSEEQTEPAPKQEDKPTKESQPSPPKTEKQIKRQKKKKGLALQQFLSKPEGDTIEVQRRQEEPRQEVPPEMAAYCKICGEASQKKKQCQFCKEHVCISHIRKKRKYQNTHKFVRICDDCEDRFIYDRYMKIQSKAEEALAMQQMIVESKRNELAELAEAKHAKLLVQQTKKQEMETLKKDMENKLKITEHDLDHKFKKMEKKQIMLSQEQIQIQKLEESLPRPLDDDHQCLEDQNAKITKELVKYEKLCAEALKAKSMREKQLYEAYNKWEKKEMNKANNSKKKEECCIY